MPNGFPDHCWQLIKPQRGDGVCLFQDYPGQWRGLFWGCSADGGQGEDTKLLHSDQEWKMNRTYFHLVTAAALLLAVEGEIIFSSSTSEAFALCAKSLTFSLFTRIKVGHHRPRSFCSQKVSQRWFFDVYRRPPSSFLKSIGLPSNSCPKFWLSMLPHAFLYNH